MSHFQRSIYSKVGHRDRVSTLKLYDEYLNYFSSPLDGRPFSFGQKVLDGPK